MSLHSDDIFSEVPSVREWHDVSREQFWSEIYPAGKPAILRGHCSDWDAVQMSGVDNAEFAKYLHESGPNSDVVVLAGRGNIDGRFFYDADMRDFNFDRMTVRFSAFLTKLLDVERGADDASIYVGATAIEKIIPGFAPRNQSDFAPQGTPALAWIGNASRIAPHFDGSDNIACCVRGTRTFLIYPPEQISNLYIGPIDHTPAGQPASLVDPRNVDVKAFPKYQTAFESAAIARLEPGDAIYIPALHWHYVESRSSLSMLVNYWWSVAGVGHGISAMANAVMAFRELPEHHRKAWRSYFDHYVFGPDAGKNLDYIPDSVKGVLGKPAPQRDLKIKSFIRNLMS